MSSDYFAGQDRRGKRGDRVDSSRSKGYMSTRNHRQRIERLEEKARQKADQDRTQPLVTDPRVQKIIGDSYLWATEYTETYNPHWVEERRDSPYEPFPGPDRYPHLVDLFEALELSRINWFEKSRDMMISWGCVAYLTLKAMTVPAREVLFQTQKLDKVKQLIKYSKCLYRSQPQFLQDAYPLSKPIDSQPDLSLVFAHGGGIFGIPGGHDQIRSYHPWGYLNDESSFQPDAGECYNEALAAVKGKIIFNSSAGPGWFADVRHDVILTEED